MLVAVCCVLCVIRYVVFVDWCLLIGDCWLLVVGSWSPLFLLLFVD